MAYTCEFLWKKHFDDPSQWWDNWDRGANVCLFPSGESVYGLSQRSVFASQASLRLRDVRHKITKESLWLDGCYDLPLIERDPSRRVLKGVNYKRSDKQLHPIRTKGSFDIVDLLKAYAKEKDLAKGSKLHVYIREHNLLEGDSYIASSLITMYARCGALAKARQVLEEFPARDVVTWNAVIAAYAQEGKGKEALKCFNNMQSEGHTPNEVTFLCALKACGSIGAVAKGKLIHENLLSLGLLETHITLANTLVDMYARCGHLARAQCVLDYLPVRNSVSWNTLLGGYVRHGKGEEALKCFDSMQQEGHCPDHVTFISALKACGIIGAATKGEQIHNKIVSLGLLGKNIVLGSTLVDMYARCGALSKGQEVLEELPVRNVVTWNALITGYALHGEGEKALECFDIMQCEGHPPTAVTFICALKACGSIRAAVKGKQIHDTIAGLGLLEKDIMLGNTLVDMYARCDELAKAQRVLEQLPVRDVVSWNALITGYVHQGQAKEALKCFDDMLRDGNSPNLVTFICALNACGSIGAADKGEQIHEKIANLALLGKDIVLGNALVDMYGRCNALTKAQEVLDELPIRDVVSWNALVAGYAQQEQGEEALKYFDSMQHEGHSPNAITLISALKACGSIGAASKGELIRDQISRLGFSEKDIMLGNSLMDMYAKCAVFEKAIQVLEQLHFQDVITWNTLTGGYAQQGQSVDALSAFERMLFKGFMPDLTTLVCVLNACSHSGLLDEAEMYFHKVSTTYCIIPKLEHYCCLTDLFGRAGKLDKALVAIMNMPSAVYLPVWRALLGACRKWGQFGIGRFAFEQILDLDTNNAATYVCMANIRTAVCLQEDPDLVEIMQDAINAGDD